VLAGGTAAGTGVRRALGATIGTAIGTAARATIGATIGTAIGTAVGAATRATVGTAVVLTGRAFAGTGVGRTLCAGHVVVERHGFSDRRPRGRRTATTRACSTAMIGASHLRATPGRRHSPS
jgi:hypothetical protein